MTGVHTVYDCLIFEAKVDGSLYVLSRGEWFEVAWDYVKQVEKELSTLKKHPTLVLPDAKENEGEGAYNKRAVAEADGSLLLLDTKTVDYGGGYSRIEICDLLGVDRNLVHVKAKTKSSTLSHLFVQGVVSAQLLRDLRFRSLASVKCGAKHAALLKMNKFDPSKFQVTFAIITSTHAPLLKALPFLSKQSLANAVRELRLMGYQVSLNKISVATAPSTMLQ